MIYVSDVCDYIDKLNIKYRVEGSKGVPFSHFCPLNSLRANAITWVRNADNLDIDRLNSIGGIVLISDYYTKIIGASFPIIYVVDPHRTYFLIIEEFFKSDNPDIHTSTIEQSAIVETEKIGNGVYIGHHSYVGPEVTIGDNVTIHHNVSIQGKTTIGNNSIIESGARIGVCGYGPYWTEDGNPVLVSHLGDTIIGRNVYIGANTCVARGCLGSTVIEDYVKIDNLVHIAHNVVLKKGAMIVANSIICGSATVEENAWIAPGAVVNESLTVGADSILGIGTIAVKNVPEHKVIVGNPGKVLREKIDGEL